VSKDSEQLDVMPWSYHQCRYKTFCVYYYQPVLCRYCVSMLCWLRVWFKY